MGCCLNISFQFILPGVVVTLSLNLLRNFQTLFQNGCIFYIPSVLYEGSSFSTSLLTLVIVCPDFSYLSECEVVFPEVLICISLMTDDVEHVFMWLFSICISLEKFLCKSVALFLVWLFLIAVNVFLIFWIQVLYWVSDLQIFSLIQWAVFSLLWCFLLKCKSLTFDGVQFVLPLVAFNVVSNLFTWLSVIVCKSLVFILIFLGNQYFL